MQDWIPTLITGAALGLVLFMIRYMLTNIKITMEKKFEDIWNRINKNEKIYLEEDKHILICGMAGLQMEKILKVNLTDIKETILSDQQNLRKEIKKDLQDLEKILRKIINDENRNKK